MSEVNIFFGNKLRLRRKKLNLSQEDLARMLGVSSQQIHKYEAGLSKLSASMLLACSGYLHVPITYFYDGANLISKEKQVAPSGNLCFERKLPLAVLLIEDSNVDTMLVEEAFAQSNTEATLLTIHDGTEALEFLRGKAVIKSSFYRPDLILLDLNMPKRNGFEILKAIKNDRNLLDIPVIILTNSINTKDMLKSYTSGASGFISKSFDVSEFNRNIATIIKYWSEAMILPSMQLPDSQKG